MTERQIIIKCLDEDTEYTCRKRGCDLPEKEGNTGKCCHKCSLQILREFEKKIYNKAIDDFATTVRPYISEYINAIKTNKYAFIDVNAIAEQLKRGN